MKNSVGLFCFLFLIACFACRSSGLEEPKPNTPQEGNDTVPQAADSLGLRIAFAGIAADGDTLPVDPRSLPTLRVEVRSAKALKEVTFFRVKQDKSTALIKQVSSFDSSVYATSLTPEELGLSAADVAGLRVTAEDVAETYAVRQLTSALLDTAKVQPPEEGDPTLPKVQFLTGSTLRINTYPNAAKPYVQFRITSDAGLQKVVIYRINNDTEIPLAEITSFADNKDFVREIKELQPLYFERLESVVVDAFDVDGKYKRATLAAETYQADPLTENLCAFPGAEGFGKNATGGRGGAVLYVTNLNDAGAGSLRAAVEAAGARTVLFKVSGTIHLSKRLAIKNGNLTIAGQTAPGDGICLAGYDVTVEANHVALRYLRFRMGAANGVESDALWGRGRSNVIIDHCSMSWSTDECASFYEMKDFSLQWCLIAESLKNSLHEKGAHGYGGIWGGQNTSFHHNLLAHHDSRNPRFASGEVCLSCADPSIGKLSPVDFRNNVVYNWGQTNSAYGGEATDINFVNNYYKPGPATKASIRERLYAPGAKTEDDGSGRFVNIINVWGGLFVEGNYVVGSANATADNWTYGIQGIDAARKAAIKRTTPFDFSPITQHSAELAYERVLSYAGASLSRDAVDLRVAAETRNGAYTYRGSNGSANGIIDNQQDVGGWPALASLTAPLDTDGDGMPDAWETANGLLPNSAADRNATTLSSVYTNLEVYLASLVERITHEQMKN
ncbi:MAG: hypothetical protein LBS63_04795 [Prevotellaceae bacterium]|jgi:pectate lyase|nr:hypothetical protein [Prevotellaceae bacterium]